MLAVLACLGWMGVSSGLILVNKYVLSTDNFHYPMALSGLGMAFSSVAAFLVCRVSAQSCPPSGSAAAYSSREVSTTDGGVQVFKWVDARKQVTWPFYITRILPIGLLMALTLHFGNAVYLHLTVSFIQMLKVLIKLFHRLTNRLARADGCPSEHKCPLRRRSRRS